MGGGESTESKSQTWPEVYAETNDFENKPVMMVDVYFNKGIQFLLTQSGENATALVRKLVDMGVDATAATAVGSMGAAGLKYLNASPSEVSQVISGMDQILASRDIAKYKGRLNSACMTYHTEAPQRKQNADAIKDYEGVHATAKDIMCESESLLESKGLNWNREDAILFLTVWRTAVVLDLVAVQSLVQGNKYAKNTTGILAKRYLAQAQKAMKPYTKFRSENIGMGHNQAGWITDDFTGRRFFANHERCTEYVQYATSSAISDLTTLCRSIAQS